MKKSMLFKLLAGSAIMLTLTFSLFALAPTGPGVKVDNSASIDPASYPIHMTAYYQTGVGSLTITGPGTLVYPDNGLGELMAVEAYGVTAVKDGPEMTITLPSEDDIRVSVRGWTGFQGNVPLR